MIVFIDNELESGYSKPWGERLMAARLRIKYRLEDISGQPCLIVRYNRVTPDLLRALAARAVLISGNSANPPDYTAADQAGLRAVFRAKTWPTFGFCGGFQVMAETYGATLAPIGPLRPDDPEPDAPPGFAPGMKKEFGYQPVRILAPHPLLAGLDEEPIMRHAHSWELKSVPEGFKVYAATDVSPIQMIVHQDLPIVGAQFHPEYYTAEHPAGRTLIENFFKMAGIVDQMNDYST